ncbi:MAG TPA: 3-phosphoshikimate 1-carboxyvinyltransferase [Terriglobia bacterium]|jgi:3-phosphoshikimate 1-carboxyvinyltransferase
MSHADRLEITPAVRLGGATTVPGDKAISHRLAMMGAIAEGTTVIRNFAESADCASTLECLRRLGVTIDRQGSTVTIKGRGLHGLEKPAAGLDAGNSGTTVRFMAGLVSGFSFETKFTGDESLSRRPMKRVIDPLRRFGASIEARDDNYLPLKVSGGRLKPIDFTLPIPSAQLKSCVLLAGLYAAGTTLVYEPVPSRNHTELALAEFGARIRTSPNTIEIDGGHPLRGREFTVPGDASSAAFFIIAALIVPGSRLALTNIGLNPTRSGLVHLLEDRGARIAVAGLSAAGGEAAGDIIVENSDILGLEIGGSWIPNVIDEIPVLAVLGTRTQNGIRIRDASELRVKESDRIRAVATNLRALGAEVEEYPDGLFVPGRQTLRGGVVDSFGDHRIAMAFAVAGLVADGPVTIKNPGCVGISFPSFFDILAKIRQGD